MLTGRTRRAAIRVSALAIGAALLLVAFGCGESGSPAGKMTNDNAAETARRLLTKAYADRPIEQRPLVSDMTCVRGDGTVWSCAAKVTVSGESVSVPVSLTCDETGMCLAKTE